MNKSEKNQLLLAAVVVKLRTAADFLEQLGWEEKEPVHLRKLAGEVETAAAAIDVSPRRHK